MSFEKIKEAKRLIIPLQDLRAATKNFTTEIGKGGYGLVYKGEILVDGILTTVAIKRLDRYAGQGDKEFLTEIQLLSRYKHPNLVSLVGVCQEGKERLLIYEYAERGSLDKYLSTKCTLTWKQRLNICIDAAQGLDYLHNHVAKNQRVIHRDIKSGNILLDHNWKAMIADLGLSKLGPANEAETYLITNACGTPGYFDPMYRDTGILTKESDVYSFGMVLFEVLCGRLCFIDVNDERRYLDRLAPRYYKEGRINEIIDPVLESQVYPASLQSFSRIAYQCLQQEREQRPSVDLVLQKLKEALECQELEEASELKKLSFQDIKVATKNFTTEIGMDAQGQVYKGQISLSGTLTTVAIKRLNNTISADQELLTEIQLLSSYEHQNLISLLGFLDEGSEKLLIYEYAERGSLDTYIKTGCLLTWKQRVNICIDAARGLDYLHNNAGKIYGVIHRDMKSANIMLDHKWKAMISYLGVSRVISANEDDTFLCSNACGTPGYIDPAYMNTGILTKESDVYSFGVVLFEVVCGRLAFIHVNSEHRFLAPLAKGYYEQQKLNQIIDSNLKNHLDSNSVKAFSEIAYQCLHIDPKERPSMGLVLQKLEKTLELLEQEEARELQMAKEFKEAGEVQKLVETLQPQIGESRMVYEVVKAIFKIRGTHPAYIITRDEIYSYLSNGILVDEGQLWFRIDDNGKNQEMISATKFLLLNEKDWTKFVTTIRTTMTWTKTSTHESRYPMVVHVRNLSHLNTEVMISAQFLSPKVTYAAYLVFKPKEEDCDLSFKMACLKYSVNDTSYISYSGVEKENGWMMIELFQTVNLKRTADFKVVLEGFDLSYHMGDAIMVEGIKFVAIQKFNDDNVKKSEYLSKSNIERGNHLPSDYGHFIYCSNNEMNSILLKGVHIDTKNEVTMWFYGKKCFMLPPKESTFASSNEFQWRPSKESRFGNVLDISPLNSVALGFDIRSGLLTTNTKYACHLVYNIKDDLVFEIPVCVRISVLSSLVIVERKQETVIYLSVPQRPVIGPDGEMRSSNPMNKLKMIELPKRREDGWWEVRLGDFVADKERPRDFSSFIVVDLEPHHHFFKTPNLTVQGIEFRSLENPWVAKEESYVNIL